MEGCYSCLKYLMFFFNFLFWLIGIGLIAIGIIGVVGDDILRKAVEVLDVEAESTSFLFKNLKTIAYVLIALGVVITILGFLGCCGAITESTCMLGTFFFFLLLIFGAIIAMGVLLFVYRNEIEKEIEKALVKEINREKDNGWQKWNTTLLAFLEKNYDCCGANNCKQDYKSTTSVSPTCNKKNCDKGCIAQFKGKVEPYYKWIAVVLLCVAGVFITGLVFSICLCCAIRREDNMV